MGKVPPFWVIGNGMENGSYGGSGIIHQKNDKGNIGQPRVVGCILDVCKIREAF